MATGAIVGGIASGVVSAGLSKLLSGGGGSKKMPSFKGINTPSFSLSPAGTLSRSDQLVPQAEQRLFGNLAANQAGILGRLPGIRDLRGSIVPAESAQRALPLTQRTKGFFNASGELQDRLTSQFDDLRPGFGRITESRVQGVRNAASQATGNLRTSLAKRNIEGSSFANRQISQIQETFAQEEDKVRAEAIVQEFQAQEQIVNDIGNLLRLDQQTLQQEAGAIALQLGLNEAEGQVFSQNIANIQTELAVTQGRISRELAELGISGDIITRVQSIASQVAIAQAKLEAENAKEGGTGFGSILSQFGAGGAFNGIFGGAGGAAAGGAAAGGAAAGGGFSAASGFASVLPLSDRRVKTDIRRVGKLDNGLAVYAYRLKFGGPTQIGVMAQDVEVVNSGAVVEIDGIKRVNYDLAVM